MPQARFPRFRGARGDAAQRLCLLVSWRTDMSKLTEIVRARRPSSRTCLRRGPGVEGRGARSRRSATCRSTCRASSSTRRACCRSASSAAATTSRSSGRRLLPVLHLPHPAQHHRARPQRQPRLPRRHDLPGDLRRDPQPLRHVADACSRTSSSATSTCRRTSIRAIGGALLPAQSCSRCATTSASAPGGRSPTTSSARLDRRLQREPRARARALRAAARSRGRCRPPSSTSCCAPGCVLPVEEHTAARARLPRRGRRRTASASRWTRRASCSPARSASSRRSA